MLCNFLLHSLYVWTARQRICDIRGKSGDPCLGTTDKGNSDQVRICLLIFKPTKLELQGKDIEETRGNPSGPTTQLRRTPSAFRSPASLPEGCGTKCWFICETPVRNQWSLKPPSETDDPSYQKLWTDLNWSAQLHCRLLFSLGSRGPSLGLIFPSLRSSALIRLNH